LNLRHCRIELSNLLLRAGDLLLVLNIELNLFLKGLGCESLVFIFGQINVVNLHLSGHIFCLCLSNLLLSRRSAHLVLLSNSIGLLLPLDLVSKVLRICFRKKFLIVIANRAVGLLPIVNLVSVGVSCHCCLFGNRRRGLFVLLDDVVSVLKKLFV
jgi:hypothetical protein